MDEAEVSGDVENVGVARYEELRRQESSPAAWVDTVRAD